MEVLEAIKTRRSVRSYASRPIPSDVFERIRQALRYAPSACNLQPWRFIFVTDVGRRSELAQAASGQLWMADAPVTVVGCALPRDAYDGMGGCGNSAEIDVAIALDHLTLAAVAEGLGTCWIGSFNKKQVEQLLQVPPQVKVVAMTPLGYPKTPDLIAPVDESERKPPSEIFATDRYGGV